MSPIDEERALGQGGAGKSVPIHRSLHALKVVED